ncbi:MAG: glycoside hydrolase family 28 protein [Lacibacter sp.]
MSVFVRFLNSKEVISKTSFCKKSLFAVMLLLFSVACSAQKETADYDKLNTLLTKDQVGAAALPDKIGTIKAPFPMPQLQRPLFPNFSISIVSKGAKEGEKITRVIQQAINEVSQQGGGKVIIPEGNWNSGRIILKSNVELHFEEGAVLQFSGAVEDYQPAVFTRHEGIEIMSLGACIYANGQRNIAITGKGRLIGPAKDSSVMKQVIIPAVTEEYIPQSKPVAERVYAGENGGPIFLPMFISPTNCSNVLIEGVSLENTAFWNIVPVYCDSVIIRGVTVNSVGIPRGDGIDIESSKNVLIEYCTLNNGDDCFTLKAGRSEDGVRINKPTENVVIRYCLAKEGHGGVTIGSETAAMIRNVYAHDCVFENTRIGIRFKTRRNRGGGGENLHYERIRMNVTSAAFLWDMLGEKKYVGELAVRLPARDINHLTPAYRNIFARDIVVDKSGQFVVVTSIPESPLSNVVIENAIIHSGKLFSAIDVNGFAVKNAKIICTEPVISVQDCRKISFENVQFDGSGKEVKVKLSGINADDVQFKNCTPAEPKG